MFSSSHRLSLKWNSCHTLAWNSSRVFFLLKASCGGNRDIPEWTKTSWCNQNTVSLRRVNTKNLRERDIVNRGLLLLSFSAATEMISSLRHSISGFQVKGKYWDSSSMPLSFHLPLGEVGWEREGGSDVNKGKVRGDRNRGGKEQEGEGDRHVRSISRLLHGAWWDMNTCKLGHIPAFCIVWDRTLLNVIEPYGTLCCCKGEYRERIVKAVYKVYKKYSDFKSLLFWNLWSNNHIFSREPSQRWNTTLWDHLGGSNHTISRSHCPKFI